MGAPVPSAPAVCCTPTRRWDVSSVHVPRLARSEASYLAGIFARFRAMASSTAFSCFNSSSRRDSVLLGLLEPDPEPDPGRAGLPDGAAGPLPDDLGGGDRGRFLSEEKSKMVQTGWEVNESHMVQTADVPVSLGRDRPGSLSSGTIHARRQRRSKRHPLLSA